MLRSTLRRPVALLGLVLIGVFVAEPLIADSCDRDGRGAVWSFSTSATPSPDGALPGDRSSVPDGSAPDHAVHVCHCTHGHFGGVPADRAVYGTLSTAGIAVAPFVQVLANTMFTPTLLRPPIA